MYKWSTKSVNPDKLQHCQTSLVQSKSEYKESKYALLRHTLQTRPHKAPCTVGDPFDPRGANTNESIPPNICTPTATLAGTAQL